jgi:predicted nucleic acid-binding protein
MTAMVPVAIDANVLVALADARDKWHSRATALRDALLAAGAELVYYDCVINEAVGVIGRRVEEQRRSDQFAHLLDGLLAVVPQEAITWIACSAQPLYRETLDLCRAHQGRLNFNDALIALKCREFGIHLILSFDGDFDDVDWLVRVSDPAAAPTLLGQTTN